MRKNNLFELNRKVNWLTEGNIRFWWKIIAYHVSSSDTKFCGPTIFAFSSHISEALYVNVVPFTWKLSDDALKPYWHWGITSLEFVTYKTRTFDHFGFQMLKFVFNGWTTGDLAMNW